MWKRCNKNAKIKKYIHLEELKNLIFIKLKYEIKLLISNKNKRERKRFFFDKVPPLTRAIGGVPPPSYATEGEYVKLRVPYRKDFL